MIELKHFTSSYDKSKIIFIEKFEETFNYFANTKNYEDCDIEDNESTKKKFSPENFEEEKIKYIEEENIKITTPYILIYKIDEFNKFIKDKSFLNVVCRNTYFLFYKNSNGEESKIKMTKLFFSF